MTPHLKDNITGCPRTPYYRYIGMSSYFDGLIITVTYHTFVHYNRIFHVMQKENESMRCLPVNTDVFPYRFVYLSGRQRKNCESNAAISTTSSHST